MPDAEGRHRLAYLKPDMQAACLVMLQGVQGLGLGLHLGVRSDTAPNCSSTALVPSLKLLAWHGLPEADTQYIPCCTSPSRNSALCTSPCLWWSWWRAPCLKLSLLAAHGYTGSSACPLQ